MVIVSDVAPLSHKGGIPSQSSNFYKLFNFVNT